MKRLNILNLYNQIKNVKKIENFYIFLPAFLAFTIPYDTNYSNVSFMLLGVFFLVSFSYSNFKKILQNKLWIILFLNTIIFLIGLIFIAKSAPNPNFDILGKYALLSAIPLLLYKQVGTHGKNMILFSFCAGVILGILWCFLSMYIFHSNEPTTYSNFTFPMGGIHPPYLSQFAVMTFFILLDLFFKQNIKWIKLFIALLLLFVFYSMVFLQARIPILAFVVCMVLYIGFKTYNDRDRRYFNYSVSFILIGILLFFGIISADGLYFIKERFLESSINALSTRVNLWRCAWQVFMDNPKALGVGFSNTQTLLDGCYKGNYFARPYFEHYNTHNQYLQILVTSGIIGLSVWLSTLIYALHKVIRSKNVLGLIFLVLFMICCITEVYLARIWGILYFSVFYSFFVIKDYKIA